MEQCTAMSSDINWGGGSGLSSRQCMHNKGHEGWHIYIYNDVTGRDFMYSWNDGPPRRAYTGYLDAIELAFGKKANLTDKQKEFFERTFNA